jgi:hypothetical protein
MSDLESILLLSLIAILTLALVQQHMIGKLESDRRYLKGIIFDVARGLKKLRIDRDDAVEVSPVRMPETPN